MQALQALQEEYKARAAQKMQQKEQDDENFGVWGQNLSCQATHKLTMELEGEDYDDEWADQGGASMAMETDHQDGPIGGKRSKGSHPTPQSADHTQEAAKFTLIRRGRFYCQMVSTLMKVFGKTNSFDMCVTMLWITR